MKKWYMRQRKGEIMIESMIGITLAVVGLFGVLALLSRSLASNSQISQKFIATYLAAEGIEVAKSIIDNLCFPGQWEVCISNGAYEVQYDSAMLEGSTERRLKFDDVTGLYGYSFGVETPFSRTITVTHMSEVEIRVISEVRWSSRGVSDKVTLEDHFFDWKL